MDWPYVLKHWGYTLILAPILSQLAKEIGLLPIRLLHNTALGNENILDKIDFNHLETSRIRNSFFESGLLDILVE